MGMTGLIIKLEARYTNLCTRGVWLALVDGGPIGPGWQDGGATGGWLALPPGCWGVIRAWIRMIGCHSAHDKHWS